MFVDAHFDFGDEAGHHDGLAGSDEYNAWHWLRGRGGLSAFNLHAVPSSSFMHNDPSVTQVLFFIDGGATHHLINDIKLFSSSVPLSSPQKISVANKGFMLATRVGSVRLQMPKPDHTWYSMEMKHVHFFPDASVCLYSVNVGSL